MVKKLYSGSLDSGYTLPFHSFVISMDYFFPVNFCGGDIHLGDSIISIGNISFSDDLS